MVSATTNNENDANMGAATPSEEIAKQHEQAARLLRESEASTMKTAPMVDYGEIPLSTKEFPMCNDNNEESQASNKESKMVDLSTTPDMDDSLCWNYCISSRGQVDVSKIQALIREGYNVTPPKPYPLETSSISSTTTNSKGATSEKKTTTATAKRRTLPKPEDVKSKTNFWDETNAAVYNVAITRPSHDAWGISKIMLVFCDDFIRRVYEMPWYSSHFHAVVEPIYQVLNIQPHQVVRLLLASLPPGVTIPLHHDTGIWVKHTHRVHVPIMVQEPEKILFTCGPSPTELQRVSCRPGHVFEMNNQAKHAVSNCSQDHRVHLILDYVNEQHARQHNLSLERILLQPGERLLQTRRSIDRLCDQGTRPTPSFLILGAQKAGTTSLYEFIMQHPLIIRPKRRETHCLDWRWNDKLTKVEDQLKHCQSFYHAKELHYYPSCLTGDSTPSYLLDSFRVIPRIQQVFPWPSLQFFVIVRDPVRRAASHYAMVTSPEGTPEQLQARGSEWRSKSMQQVVQDEMTKLKEYGVIPYWDIANGICNEAEFERFKDSPQEDQAWNNYIRDHVPLNTGSHNLIARGLYALQLRPWLRVFAPERFLMFSLERDLTPDALPQTLQQVWQHLKLPDCDVKDTKPRNTREYDDMDADVKNYLQLFYAPHNRRLHKLLRSIQNHQDVHDPNRWVDPWPYSESRDSAA